MEDQIKNFKIVIDNIYMGTIKARNSIQAWETACIIFNGSKFYKIEAVEIINHGDTCIN